MFTPLFLKFWIAYTSVVDGTQLFLEYGLDIVYILKRDGTLFEISFGYLAVYHAIDNIGNAFIGIFG